MTTSPTERTLELVKKAGVLRPRDLDAHGIPRTYLQRLCERGVLERVSFGLYRMAGGELTEKQSQVEAARRIPDGVLCLLTALQFHGLTSQSPHEVWVAVRGKAWRPKAGSVPLQIIHVTGPAFEHGVEAHEVGGVTMRVYSAAKTVADCFKFRSRVGLDVAMEALRDYRRQHRGGMDALWKAAEVCRVTRVMKPYLEATEWSAKVALAEAARVAVAPSAPAAPAAPSAPAGPSAPTAPGVPPRPTAPSAR